MRYFIDKEKKYFDDLLFHLRAHNKSFTGEKTKESKHIYVFDNEKLVGYGNPGSSWDWAGIGNLYYTSLDVLRAIVSTTCDIFKGKIVGISAYTPIEERKDDLLKVGYYVDSVGYAVKRLGQLYILYLKDINYTFEHNYKVNVLDEELKEHKEFLTKYQEKYAKKNNLNITVNEELYVALEDKEFAGGIFIQQSQDSLYVDLLAVNPKYKGKKVGTKLMEYAERYARDKFLEYVDLGTASFQARPFYEKLGYKVTHTKKDQPKGFECYKMVKFLDYEE